MSAKLPRGVRVGLRTRAISGCEIFHALGPAFHCKREARVLIEYIPVDGLPVRTILLVCTRHNRELQELTDRQERERRRVEKRLAKKR